MDETNKTFCPKCGKELTEGSAFCPACGVSLTEAPIPTVETYNSDTVKKKSKSKVIIIVAACVVLCIAFGIINYFTGDEYKYNNALNLLEEEKYSEAFEIFNNLGDYKNSASYLPFNGKYTNISITDQRTLTFDNGDYTKMIPSTDGDDSYYYGKYTVNGYMDAVLTDNDDNEPESYEAYENYIYSTGNEEVVFDEKIDISNGYFDSPLTEKMSYAYSGHNVDFYYNYDFDADGTYTFKSSSYFENSSESFYGEDESGTYEIVGNTIVLTPNENSKVKTFLVIDGTVYRDVYIREY